MEENSITSEKNYIKDSLYYPALSINSGKTSKKRRKFSYNVDINKSDIKDSIEDYFLNVLENNFNDNFQETNSNIKINNFSNNSDIKLEIKEKKYKRKKVKKEKKEFKKCGRKKKNSNEKGIHDKYTSDNIIRKCKAVLLQIISRLINNKIKEVYGKDANYSSKRTRLMKMNQFQVVNSNIKFNQEFLYKKIKDIFSEKLSSRCTTYSKEHNKILINYLLNEKDKVKKKIFEEILNLTFLDCLKHFRGEEIFSCLKELKNYDEVCEEFKDESYKESFRCYIDNFEKIIENKKSRRNKKHI